MKKLLALLSIASMFAVVGCDDDNDNSSKTPDNPPVTTECTANACVANTNLLNECVNGSYVPKDCGAAGCNPVTNSCNTSTNPPQAQCTVSVCSGNILNECVNGSYVPKDCAAGCDPVNLVCKTSSSGGDDPSEDEEYDVETSKPCDYDTFDEYCEGNKYHYCDYSDADEDKDVIWEGTCPSTHSCATTTVKTEEGSYVYSSCVSNTAGEESDFCDAEGSSLYICDVDDFLGMYVSQYAYTCMKWSDNKLHYFPLPDMDMCTTCTEKAGGCVLEACDASANASSCNGMTGKSCEEFEDGKSYMVGLDCSFMAEYLGSSGCIMDEGYAMCDFGDLLDE